MRRDFYRDYHSIPIRLSLQPNLAQTDALGHTTSYDYNDRQQLIAMILP
ncbi:hypothetical protein E5343_12425, partial [Rodentibacter caecimuris]